MNKTYITMTSIQNRFSNFEKTIPVLVDNADKVFIKICGTLEYPKILDSYSNIEIEVSEDKLGSEQKFHGFRKIQEDGYIFTCDDDIYYSPEYFALMKNTIDQYDKKCGVSLHAGCIDFDTLIKNYWKYRRMYSMYHPLGMDIFCNIICSVTAGYHTSTFKIYPEDCLNSQMDDVYATIELCKRDLAIVTPQRPEGTIKQLSSGGYAIHSGKGGSGGHPYEKIDELINVNKQMLIDYQKRKNIFGR